MANEIPGSEHMDLPDDAPWNEKPGESHVAQGDIDVIPEREITEEDLHQTTKDETNWLLFGGAYENQRHTTAEHITPDNVDEVELEWRIDLAPPHALEPNPSHEFQGSPLVVDGDPPIMYITVGADQLYAVNARTGEKLWEHYYEPAVGYSEDAPPAERGPAVLGGTVYKSTLDLGVLAVDRYTGEEQWYYNGAAAYRGEVADGLMHEELQWERERGSTSSFPPLIYDGKLMKGSFGGEFGVSGFFDAIDLEGNPQWRFNMTPTEQWVGDSWQHGGGTAWASGAIEPEEGTVIVPSANPGPWYGTVRPGFNPFTCGKVAIDIESGEYQWHHQDVPHDWWDYDSPSPPLVFEEEHDGEPTKFATWPGKTGWVYTVNMETGQLHQRSDEYVQHVNTFSLPPYEDIENAPWMMPHLTGGTNPQPSSFDPNTRTMVVKGANEPMALSWYEEEYEAGERYMGMDIASAEPPEEVEEPDEPTLSAEEVAEEEDPHLEAEVEEEEDQEDEDVDEGEDGEATEDGEEDDGPPVGQARPDYPEEWNGATGVIAGIDPYTGDVKWQEWYDWTNFHPRGGSFTTPTGLAFAGTPNGVMVAYDIESGDRLAEFEVADHGVDGAPMSWVDPHEEKQYIAMPAGGGHHTDVELGTTLAVFSLEI
ncbi:pyrroloquinoline quinone-dependent dehydrogenase [Natrinema soli]|uniref:Pyrroloquinoline quinone-dependent dehydrogenase n=1 Tax=Natrinema soli TaxID=1930624 RepID=A0ABD5SYT9_9EURY|nr:PQQ-binding-like beta-propeller repeat protein [Natrinema soli]